MQGYTYFSKAEEKTALGDSVTSQASYFPCCLIKNKDKNYRKWNQKGREYDVTLAETLPTLLCSSSRYVCVPSLCIWWCVAGNAWQAAALSSWCFIKCSVLCVYAVPGTRAWCWDGGGPCLHHSLDVVWAIDMCQGLSCWFQPGHSGEAIWNRIEQFSWKGLSKII